MFFSITFSYICANRFAMLHIIFFVEPRTKFSKTRALLNLNFQRGVTGKEGGGVTYFRGVSAFT